MNLFIGSHPDDVEIHCAGTMLKLLDNNESVETLILTKGEDRAGNRVDEQIRVFDHMGIQGYVWWLKDGDIRVNSSTVARLDAFMSTHQVKRVFVHTPDDLHQDHRATSHLVQIANRHKIFDLYYYPPTDVTREFKTNVFVDITDYYDRKIEILKMFESQQDRWYLETERTVPFAKHVERFQVEFMKGL